MNKPIGGRGKKAPYETTHVRIPVELKLQVEELVENYRNNGLVIKNKDDLTKKIPIDYHELIKVMIEKFKDNDLFIGENLNREHPKIFCLSLEESIKHANSLLSSSRTKKALAENLLTAIYQVEVKL